MLREILVTKQRANEPRRRWFYAKDLELIVWLDDRESVVGIQLAYDKDSGNPHALTWKAPDEFHHDAIDTGETHPLKPKASPILLANGAFDADRVVRAFRAASGDVPAQYSEMVIGMLQEFGARDAA